MQSESGTVFENGGYMAFTAETLEPESLVGTMSGKHTVLVLA